mmetsp:Transcript_1286/g.1528  ORF Transcript_1286/g.1528 Transcript_1286/m.1528 type:complete len:330 (+) Transcript_1286:133-1122(+)|eukprot:CAMPEP_0184052890 /NCGR_PEP_ID=MMETSP0956-20121227/5596_1 /TAXON_ID=627963 /ORGANISM="Aplanochytrium sp, Strain PBS07" /LENGTH=329 /DNA_ID=CAMNT_0026346101 /DNA_START=72 /DNA_END=1061 /DNA_ORIENTATION=-
MALEHKHQRLIDQAAKDDRQAVVRGFKIKVGDRVLQADVLNFKPKGEESCASDKRKVVIFFPGNPGLVDFYLTMLRQIYERENGNVWISAIGHAGHSEYCHETTKDPVSYAEQIAWKEAYILQAYPWLHDEDVECIISGHSVGARIGLEVVKRLPQVNFKQFIGLCPTVMNIAESPNGKKVTSHLASSWKRWLAFWAIRFLQILLYPLPDFLKLYIAKRVMRNDSPLVDDYFVQFGLKLVNPDVIKNVLHMANDEMRLIRDVSHLEGIITTMKERIVFVLSSNDKWCCNNIVSQMKVSFPEAQYRVLSDGVPHAFCLSHNHVEEVVAHF